MKIGYLLAALCMCCIVATGLSRVLADNPPSGITVSPTIEQLLLKAGQTDSTYTIHVTNNTASTVAITASAKNFSSFNQNGGINLNTSSKSASQNTHGLASNLSIEQPQITLSPGQSQAVPITINNADKLAAGGHYAAILLQFHGAVGTGGNHVSVSQGIASLLFLTSHSNGTQNIKLSGRLMSTFTTTFPNELNTVFADSGNTQATPRGTIQILNAWSHVVSQGQININSGLVLPGSNGLFNTAMVQTSKRPWIGLYRVRVVYGHDGQAQPTVYIKHFIYVNKLVVGVVLAIILLAIVAILRKFAPKPTYRLKTR